MKILSLLIFACAALTIYFEYQDRRFLYFFKPAALVLIIALVRRGGGEDFYRRAILAGLFFSLVGDTLLIDPRNFVFGLAGFLIAHLFYVAAFVKAAAKRFNPLALGAYPFGLALFLAVFGGVPENLKIPVVVYTLAISTMLAAAANFYLTRKTPASLYAVAGAAVFVASDAVLAVNKFTYEFFSARALLLATYFFAQWLIARSTVNE